MKSIKTVVCAMLLLAAIGLYCVPAMATSSNSVVQAGFSGLPLRNCQGTYCGELRKLPMGQQLKVLFNSTGDGWSYVEVVGSGDKGWVCNANVY